MSDAIDILSYAKQYSKLDSERLIRQASDAVTSNESKPSDSPFLDIPILLTSIPVPGGLSLNSLAGKEVIFLREGSHPGARFTIVSGGVIAGIYPGCRFKVPLTGAQLLLNNYGASNGYGAVISSPYTAPGSDNLFLFQPGQQSAVFRVIKNDGFDFQEPPYKVDQSTPIVILADAITGLSTFVAKDTPPADEASNGAFEITGWERIRIMIDTFSNGANATSFELVPWVDPIRGGIYYQQGTERIYVPDTDVTAGRYRILDVAVCGYGVMYFEIRNLLSASRTGLGFWIWGIR